MISRRYGVRSVRHGPGSALDFFGSRRCASAHCDTVSSVSGRRPSALAPSMVARALLIDRRHRIGRGDQCLAERVIQNSVDTSWVAFSGEL